MEKVFLISKDEFIRKSLELLAKKQDRDLFSIDNVDEALHFIEDLKPSSTLAINQKVQELRHNGNSVFHFGFGQSPFPIHNSITTALTEHVKDNSYLPTIGLEPLRKQILGFNFIGSFYQLIATFASRLRCDRIS